MFKKRSYNIMALLRWCTVNSKWTAFKSRFSNQRPLKALDNYYHSIQPFTHTHPQTDGVKRFRATASSSVAAAGCLGSGTL